MVTPSGVGSVGPIGWVFRAERSGFLTGTTSSSKWANLIYIPAQVSLIPAHSQACWGERALGFGLLSLSRRDGKGPVTSSGPGPGYSVPFGAAV